MKISEDVERNISVIAARLNSINDYADEHNAMMVRQHEELRRIANQLERIANHFEKELG